MYSWKRLGDDSHIPTTQHLGTCVPEGTTHSQDWDVQTFVRLAAGYKVDGSDRGKLCEENAEVRLL